MRFYFKFCGFILNILFKKAGLCEKKNLLDLTCDISAVISNILAEGITLELVILYVWSVYDKRVSITVENINKYSYCVDSPVVFCCISTTFSTTILLYFLETREFVSLQDAMCRDWAKRL